jgi:3-deoxy-D-manno-octulosonic-acid transferase
MILLLSLVLWNLLFPFGALLFGFGFLVSRRRGLLKSLASEWPERMGLIPRAQRGSPVQRPLWIHAASLGEVNAALPLIEELRAARRPLILTSTNRAGVERARALGLRAHLAPLDWYPAVGAFLRRARPSALILVETELWPQMITLASARGLALVIVNGAVSERSLRRYLLLRPVMKALLSRFRAIAAQTEEDAERFISLGAPDSRVTAVGNIKYDLKPPSGRREASEALQALGWKGYPIFVAASTHPDEEDVVLEGFLKSLEKLPDLRLVIAPRHVERASELAANLQDRAIAFRSYSGVHAPLPNNPRALLVDVQGVLPQFYGLAVASFVGGTLNALGGHNILEPAVEGSPVLFGPHLFKVRAPARALIEGGGGFEIRHAADIAERLGAISRHPEWRERSREAARSLAGATSRTLRVLENALKA